MDFAGDGDDQLAREIARGAVRRLLMQFDEGELNGLSGSYLRESSEAHLDVNRSTFDIWMDLNSNRATAFSLA